MAITTDKDWSPIDEEPFHTRLKVWIILIVEDPYDLKINNHLQITTPKTKDWAAQTSQ
jgi:hypothetical protein